MKRDVDDIRAELRRLGADDELFDALLKNLGSNFFFEELHDVPILPRPDDATSDNEYLLAAAFANVRRARGSELRAAREARRRGGVRQAKKLKASKSARLERLADWVAKESPKFTLSSVQLCARLAGESPERLFELIGEWKAPGLRAVRAARKLALRQSKLAGVLAPRHK